MNEANSDKSPLMTSTSSSQSLPTPTVAKKLPQEVKHLISGGLAGMIAKTFVAPIDRIKILYQVTSAPFRLRDVPSVATNIVNQEGLNGLWRGNTATMIRIFPYAGIQFMVFNRMKTFFADHPHFPFGDENEVDGNNAVSGNKSKSSMDDKKWGMTALQSLVAGSTAGACSVLMTYPLDLTRAQLAVLKKQKCNRGTHVDNHGFARVLSSNYSNGVS